MDVPAESIPLLSRKLVNKANLGKDILTDGFFPEELINSCTNTFQRHARTKAIPVWLFGSHILPLIRRDFIAGNSSTFPSVLARLRKSGALPGLIDFAGQMQRTTFWMPVFRTRHWFSMYSVLPEGKVWILDSVWKRASMQLYKTSAFLFTVFISAVRSLRSQMFNLPRIIRKDLDHCSVNGALRMLGSMLNSNSCPGIGSSPIALLAKMLDADIQQGDVAYSLAPQVLEKHADVILLLTVTFNENIQDPRCPAEIVVHLLETMARLWCHCIDVTTLVVSSLVSPCEACTLTGEDLSAKLVSLHLPAADGDLVSLIDTKVATPCCSGSCVTKFAQPLPNFVLMHIMRGLKPRNNKIAISIPESFLEKQDWFHEPPAFPSTYVLQHVLVQVPSSGRFVSYHQHRSTQQWFVVDDLASSSVRGKFTGQGTSLGGPDLLKSAEIEHGAYLLLYKKLPTCDSHSDQPSSHSAVHKFNLTNSNFDLLKQDFVENALLSEHFRVNRHTNAGPRPVHPMPCKEAVSQSVGDYVCKLCNQPREPSMLSRSTRVHAQALARALGMQQLPFLCLACWVRKNPVLGSNSRLEVNLMSGNKGFFIVSYLPTHDQVRASLASFAHDDSKLDEYQFPCLENPASWWLTIKASGAAIGSWHPACVSVSNIFEFVQALIVFRPKILDSLLFEGKYGWCSSEGHELDLVEPVTLRNVTKQAQHCLTSSAPIPPMYPVSLGSLADSVTDVRKPAFGYLRSMKQSMFLGDAEAEKKSGSNLLRILKANCDLTSNLGPSNQVYFNPSSGEVGQFQDMATDALRSGFRQVKKRSSTSRSKSNKKK